MAINAFEKEMNDLLKMTPGSSMSSDMEGGEELNEELDDDNSTMVMTPLEDGSFEVEFIDTPLDDEDENTVPTEANEHDANLASFLDTEQLDVIRTKLDERYQSDKASMSDFLLNVANGLEHLGISISELDDPFPGASPVTHPLILEAALKTQAKIMGEVFNGRSLVDTYLTTAPTEEIMQKANRVRNFMDFQYLHLMKEFLPETERMTFRFALTGNAYRKYYYDPIRGRPATKYVTEDKFIVNESVTTLEDADMYTELYSMPKHELLRLIDDGIFVDIFATDTNGNLPSSLENGLLRNDEGYPGTGGTITDVDHAISIETGDPMGIGTSTEQINDTYWLREYHCMLQLPEPFNDGEVRALPYIVTAEDGNNKILSIRRNWKKNDGLRLKRTWYSHYKLIPGLGFFGLGYIHILGNFQLALTAISRSLIDAGQFANLQGGFRSKGIRFSRDVNNVPIRFGEYREIDTQGKPIQDVLYQLNFKEPSQVLERILQFLDGRAQKFADSTEQVIADSTNYGPVGTTVALLEASTKFVNGILKRFYYSLSQEFKILYDLNADVLDDEQTFYYRSRSYTAKKEDFTDSVIDVIPAADPNMSSSAHRISMAQTKLSAAQQQPDIHDMRVAYREFYIQLGMEIEEIDRLLPPKDTAEASDPFTDIVKLTEGKPIKAFPGQDHAAHIQFKSAFLNDPTMGGAPIAQGLIPLIQANIGEHMLLQYKARLDAAAQAMGGDPAKEMDMANAAKYLSEVNSKAQLVDGVTNGDPATIVAEASRLDAKTRSQELEHKRARDLASQVTANRELDLKEKELALKAMEKDKALANDLKKKKMEIGANLIKESLGGLSRSAAKNNKPLDTNNK